MATVGDLPPSRAPWFLWRLRRRAGQPGTPQAPTTQPSTTQPSTLPPTTPPPTTSDTYLAPGECVLSVTRRHSVALGSTAFLWLGSLMVGLATGISYNQAHDRLELSYLGAGIILAGAVFAGWKVWRWKVARFVLTDQRLLFVEGIVSRHVNALPLKSVLDTTYHQTVAGRLFGYADITLNLSGDPGLRRLTRLSQPLTLYYSILSLTAVRDVSETTPPGFPDAGGHRGF